MNIAKLISGAPILTLAALLGSPPAASAQSGSPADSTASRGRPAWVTGTAAAAGAGLFLAFVHSGHGDQLSGTPHTGGGNGNSSPLTPIPPATTAPVPSPAGGSTDGTPPTQTNGDTAVAPSPGTQGFDAPPGNGLDVPPPPVVNDPPPVVNDPPPVVDDPPPVVNDPPPVVNEPPPVVNDPPPPTITDAPSPPQDDPIFVPGTDEQPLAAGIDSNDGMSTVPEPGALALTATGIIGLVPLVRRRRK